MRRNYQQISVVSGNTPQEFQDKLNAELKRIAQEEGKYSVQYNMNMGLCAYITYEHEEKESRVEEYVKEVTCKDCPFFVPVNDERASNKVLFGTCMKLDCKTNKNDKVCSSYYAYMDKEKR